jgi:hypothetical protein
MSLVGAAGGGISSIINGFAESAIAKDNAAAFYAQAQNIQTQKGIVSTQYGTQGNVLQGQAIATAGRQGVKVSGTIAQSISSSLTELNLQKGYELYNLEVERVKAINAARQQEFQGKMAIANGFFGAAKSMGSALSDLGSSNYFSNSNTKPEYLKNTQKTFGKKSYKTGLEYGYTGNASGIA